MNNFAEDLMKETAYFSSKQQFSQSMTSSPATWTILLTVSAMPSRKQILIQTDMIKIRANITGTSGNDIQETNFNFDYLRCLNL